MCYVQCIEKILKMESVLSLLEKACNMLGLDGLEYKNWENIPIGQYIMDKFVFADTRYGRRIRASSTKEGFFTFLPERFNRVFTTEEQLKVLNAMEYYMTRLPKNPKFPKRVNLKFAPVNASEIEDVIDLTAVKNGEMKRKLDSKKTELPWDEIEDFRMEDFITPVKDKERDISELSQLPTMPRRKAKRPRLTTFEDTEAFTESQIIMPSHLK